MAKTHRKLMSNVVQFISKLDLDCMENHKLLIAEAKNNFAFEVVWDDPIWNISKSVRNKIRGSDTRKTKNLNYLRLTPNHKTPLIESFSNIVKALTTLRFIRGGQCTNNLQNFIDGFRYIYEAMDDSKSIESITREILDNAAKSASLRLSAGTAYNIHKAIHEIADLLDANRLVKILLGYRFSGLKRPFNTSGVSFTKLDDPKNAETKSSKMADENVIEALGKLYRIIPASATADRVRILLVSLAIFTGRRIGEILTMPSIPVRTNENNTSFLTVYTEKKSQGNLKLSKERVVLPSQVVEIVRSIIDELLRLTEKIRRTAEYIHLNNHADYRIIEPYISKGWMDKHDIQEAFNVFNGIQWARQRKLASVTHPSRFRSICWSISEIKKGMDSDIDASPTLISDGFELPHKDTLAILYPNACHSQKASITYATSSVSWQQISDFLGNNQSRRFDKDSLEGILSVFDKYLLSEDAEKLRVNSHAFRHSINTWLDEGGLSDIAQSKWFGRKNDRDTKAYQHTSPVKAALLVRKDLLDGKIVGPLAKQIEFIPILEREAFLEAKLKAVHDVGNGVCFHDYSQSPCERSLQCSADCDDFHWLKDDAGIDNDLKRQFALTSIARSIAEERSTKGRGKSIDWLNHNDKKLATLKRQLSDRGIQEFNPDDYLVGKNE